MIEKLKQYRYAYGLYQKKKPASKFRKVFDLIEFVTNKRFVTYKGLSYIDYAMQFAELLSKMKIKGLTHGYLYPYDTDTIRCIPQSTLPIASVTVNYEWLLKGCWEDRRKEIDVLSSSDYKDALLVTFNDISRLISLSVQILQSEGTSRSSIVATYLKRMLTEPCQGFDEAIQRILFFNGLLWQNGHQQNGIGRLDILLYPYFHKGIEEGTLTKEEAKEMLLNMVKVLGRDMLPKSASEQLPGDTGQVIILGGVDERGNYVENEITYMMLEIFHEHPVPDPKLLVKVNEHTSQAVWRKSIDSILTGCGSPLLMNEKLIMDGMKAFGYEENDVWNFGTSACWEPLIIGKSFDQNNRIKNIPVVECVNVTLKEGSYNDYMAFEDAVIKELRQLLRNWPLDVSFDKSPLMTLLFDDCIKTRRDFCDGGAKYNYHGLLVVGLPNLINAMLNIRDYVFEQNLFTMGEVKEALSHNYAGHEDMLQLFRNNKNKFGLDHEDIVSLTNRITSVIDEEVSKLKILEHRVKVGFSSPGYIGLAASCSASPDGRKFGEPFAVHISPITSEIDINEIFRFAAQMDYSGTRINGNVVDFIVPSSYASQPKKLTGIVKAGMLYGIFELQMNVLDKATLIDAKAHPERYPNLIVRVWGFSAYFNDLPEEYKDNLIARAEKYEAN